jgi:hypothetical protein
MMRPGMRSRLLPTSVLVILALAVGGTAQAYWAGAGGGAGAGTTETIVALRLNPGTPAYALFPGGRTDVVLIVANPNASVARIGSLALDPGQGAGGFAVDGSHSGCDVSTLSFTNQTNGGAGWTVPASGTLPVTLADALAMDTGAANACQGARFTVYLAAGP